MKTFKKLSFSEKIQRRNRLLIFLEILMFVYMIVVGELGLGDSRYMSDLADLVSRVIFFCGMIYIFIKIRRNNKLLKNRELLKQQYQLEHEEMRRVIHEKSGGIVWDIVLICQLFITLTTSLTNMASFYSALITLTVMIIAKLVCVLYIKKHGCEF